MAIDDRTIRLTQGLRLVVNARVDAADQALIVAYARAWEEVASEWQAATTALVNAATSGRRVTITMIVRQKYAARALEVTRDLLDDLTRDHLARVLSAVPDIVDTTAAGGRTVTLAQLPDDPAAVARVVGDVGHVSRDAVRAIITRTAGQVESLTWPLAVQAEAAMKSSLIGGVALGRHPTRVAADMVARVKGSFDGGLARALVISRTEMLDAHRAAAQAQRMATTQVTAGWQWIASMDVRTCPGCLSKHGEVFPPETFGPDDHQQGRCSALPVTKSWADLGFKGIDEPPSLVPDAEAWFRGLPRETQRSMMGDTRLGLLDSGRIGWSDLAQKRAVDGWRDSWAPTPVSVLTAKAAA